LQWECFLTSIFFYLCLFFFLIRIKSKNAPCDFYVYQNTPWGLLSHLFPFYASLRSSFFSQSLGIFSAHLRPLLKVAELGERLRSASVPTVSKPFQKYYRKAREGRSGHLDENLVAESMVALSVLISFSTKEEAAVIPALRANSVKGFVKPSSSMKGFLRRGFLNPSLAMKASTTHTSLLETVVSSSAPEVKEVGVVGLPSPLGGCVTPYVRKCDDSRVNGLSQSQKWPIGFGPSREMIVWEQGDKI